MAVVENVSEEYPYDTLLAYTVLLERKVMFQYMFLSSSFNFYGGRWIEFPETSNGRYCSNAPTLTDAAFTQYPPSPPPPELGDGQLDVLKKILFFFPRDHPCSRHIYT
jgi:hypothetical protein